MSIFSAVELANMGEDIVNSGMSGDKQAQPEDGGREKKKFLPTATKKKILFYGTLTLLIFFAAYQTFIQFMLKMVENKDVLDIVSTYIEKTSARLVESKNKIECVVLNNTHITCQFVPEERS